MHLTKCAFYHCLTLQNFSFGYCSKYVDLKQTNKSSTHTTLLSLRISLFIADELGLKYAQTKKRSACWSTTRAHAEWITHTGQSVFSFHIFQWKSQHLTVYCSSLTLPLADIFSIMMSRSVSFLSCTIWRFTMTCDSESLAAKSWELKKKILVSMDDKFQH